MGENGRNNSKNNRGIRLKKIKRQQRNCKMTIVGWARNKKLTMN